MIATTYILPYRIMIIHSLYFSMVIRKIMQLNIPWILWEHKDQQTKILFPMSASKNQEVIEQLKSLLWLSIAESVIRDRAIEDEKNRPIYFEK